MERRICERFEIPGATVSYKKKGLLGPGKNYIETSCPVIEISYGGMRFLNQKSLDLNDQVLVEVSLSEEKQPLTLLGQVKWCDLHPGKSYRYQTGIQFNPYGQKKGQNAPQILKQLKSLGEKNIIPA
jgi:Tfp pilus assembly protein PilZ